MMLVGAGGLIVYTWRARGKMGSKDANSSRIVVEVQCHMGDEGECKCESRGLRSRGASARARVPLLLRSEGLGFTIRDNSRDRSAVVSTPGATQLDIFAPGPEKRWRMRGY